jgi:hypothetical protein
MGVFRLGLVGRLNGADETRNIFTFDSGGGGLPDASEVNAWLDTLYTTDFLDQLSPLWSSERWIIEEPNVGGLWEYRLEGAYHKTGAGASETFPQQMAYVLIGITPSRRRGKKFIAGVPEVKAQNGVIVGTVIPHLQLYADAWIAGMSVGVGTAFSGVCHPDGTNFLAFNSTRVDAILGTQRRRKQGSGS